MTLIVALLVGIVIGYALGFERGYRWAWRREKPVAGKEWKSRPKRVLA